MIISLKMHIIKRPRMEIYHNILNKTNQKNVPSLWKNLHKNYRNMFVIKTISIWFARSMVDRYSFWWKRVPMEKIDHKPTYFHVKKKKNLTMKINLRQIHRNLRIGITKKTIEYFLKLRIFIRHSNYMETGFFVHSIRNTSTMIGKLQINQ